MQERVDAIDPLNSIYSEPMETDAAALFCAVISDQYVYVKDYPQRHKWFHYDVDSGTWNPDTDGIDIGQAAINFTSCLYAYTKAFNDGRQYPNLDYERFAKGLSKGQQRHSLIRAAEETNILTKTMDSFDANPSLLNCKDCVIEIPARTINGLSFPKIRRLPHSPTYLLTKTCNVFAAEAVEKDPTPYHKLIQSAFDGKDIIDYVNTVLGYSLTADNPEKKYFTLVGKGNTGKSLLMKCLRTISGDYGESFDYSTFADSQKKGGAPRADIMKLKGLHAAITSEPKENFVIDSQMIKSITGRDETNTRGLYMTENQSFTVGAKIWIMSNTNPVINDPIIFESGRVCLINMNHVIPADQQDTQLEEKLLSEPSKSYIFQCWLDGLQRYLNDPTAIKNYPPYIAAATERYQMEQDPIECFWNECATPSKGASVKAAEAHDIYSTWCNQNKTVELGRYKFNQALKRHGYMKATATVDGNTVHNVVTGYRLSADNDLEF